MARATFSKSFAFRRAISILSNRILDASDACHKSGTSKYSLGSYFRHSVFHIQLGLQSQPFLSLPGCFDYLM